MTITLNQTTCRGQTLSDITTCSHIAEIGNSAFSDACKSYSFLCNTSKKVVKMQTLHGHNKQSGRSGFDHFSADQTCT